MDDKNLEGKNLCKYCKEIVIGACKSKNKAKTCRMYLLKFRLLNNPISNNTTKKEK